MNTLDKYLLIHLAIEIVFAVFYLSWQFERVSFPEKGMQLIIAILNLIETVLLVLTRFLPFSGWGAFALGAWYVLNTILLLMQFVLADWGWRYKVQDVLWIILYVNLFMHDVIGISIIHKLIAKYGGNLIEFGEKIKGTYWGDIVKSIIIVLVKEVVNLERQKPRKNKGFSDLLPRGWYRYIPQDKRP